jgi:hypothetical protein
LVAKACTQRLRRFDRRYGATGEVKRLDLLAECELEFLVTTPQW